MYPFLAFEGCDGAGKTTILRLLSHALTLYNLPVFTVGQHSWLHLESSRIIAKVRSGSGNLSADEISLAYRLDKKYHYKFNIAPAQSKAVVIRIAGFLVMQSIKKYFMDCQQKKRLLHI